MTWSSSSAEFAEDVPGTDDHATRWLSAEGFWVGSFPWPVRARSELWVLPRRMRIPSVRRRSIPATDGNQNSALLRRDWKRLAFFSGRFRTVGAPEALPAW